MLLVSGPFFREARCGYEVSVISVAAGEAFAHAQCAAVRIHCTVMWSQGCKGLRCGVSGPPAEDLGFPLSFQPFASLHKRAS